MKKGREKSGEARTEAAREFAEAHDPDIGHALQVCKNSLALFDALKELHGLGNEERLLLEAAALMHDTGYGNRPMEHHKGSRDLILSSGLPGYSKRELAMVACIARYHRKGPPKPSHSTYKDLDEEDQRTVARLSGLLRIADGLDRSHVGSVSDLRAEQTHDTVHLYIQQCMNNPTDIAYGLRKGGLFSEVFGVNLEITAEAGHQVKRS